LEENIADRTQEMEQVILTKVRCTDVPLWPVKTLKKYTYCFR